jgi:DNA-binding beta-propeller fold protein YncE
MGTQGVWVYPPGQTVPSKSFDSGGNPWGFALGSTGTDLYVVDICQNACTKTAVLIYDYVSGKMISSFPGGGNTHSDFFIAVTPRAPF